MCVLAYVDDLVMLGKSEEELSELLSVLEKWCDKWRVTINTAKTKIMHFRRKHVNPTNKPFNVCGARLESVSSYRYLGINMNCCLEAIHTAEILAAAGSHALGNIISKTRSNYDPGFQCYSNLFNSMVAPVLD